MDDSRQPVRGRPQPPSPGRRQQRSRSRGRCWNLASSLGESQGCLPAGGYGSESVGPLFSLVRGCEPSVRDRLDQLQQQTAAARLASPQLGFKALSTLGSRRTVSSTGPMMICISGPSLRSWLRRRHGCALHWSVGTVSGRAARLVLDESQRGRAEPVVCVGEPGIGKTRLVEELTGRARDQGVLTAWGRTSTDGAPPYWPWREVLRALETAGLATQGTLADAATSGVEPSLEERVRRFDEVARLGSVGARSRPLLVVLDDVDGADEGSQLLVQYLARTARDDPLWWSLAAANTAGPLGRLGPGAQYHSGRAPWLGARPSVAGLRPCRASGQRAEAGCGVRPTAGNPFFGASRPPLAAVPPSRGLCRCRCRRVGQRLERLSATARRRCVQRRCWGPGSRSPSSRR